MVATRFKKMMLGSVAEEVFRQADCPVLTVGPQAEAQVPRELGLENILLATDFGPSAERAARYAFSLAQECGARLGTLLKTCVPTLRKRRADTRGQHSPI